MEDGITLGRLASWFESEVAEERLGLADFPLVVPYEPVRSILLPWKGVYLFLRIVRDADAVPTLPVSRPVQTGDG